MIKKENLIKISDWIWEIPKKHRSDMLVPARVYSSEKMLDDIFSDRSLDQLINVATLPGIQKFALSMPDIHEGYGFPIGGVAAFSLDEGIISPGGIGYDINCGVRLLRSDKNLKEISSHIEDLGHAMYKEIPSGVGRAGSFKFNDKDLDRILNEGVKKVIELGYGEDDDLNRLESNGFLKEADASFVSNFAKNRGRDQLGTMGAGNHFVEVDVVEEIFDEEEATKMNIFLNQIVILIHTGSRGLGHQVATDYIKIMMKAMSKYNINVADRELACVPFKSKEGQQYFSAMSASANFAWSNRQFITWEIRKVWQNIFGKSDKLNIVYDVAHNIAKVETHLINNKEKEVVVHRKGATRSFPGQPVLIPGSMGTNSYLLVGQDKSMEETFGSTCHGAGRTMSRTEAKKMIEGVDLRKDLKEKGIIINTKSVFDLPEEAPSAYKNIDDVVEVVNNAGIAKKVAKLKPLVVIKG